MYGIFTKVLNMGLSAGIFIFVIIFLRIILKNMPKKYVCILWALVAFRLICPFSIPSSLSVYNLFGAKDDMTNGMEYFQYNNKAEKPELSFYVPALVNDNMSPDSMLIGVHTSKVYIPVFMYIWLSGIVAMLIYALISYLRLKKVISASICRGDNVYICDELKSPFIFGIMRPHIYLPSGLSKKVQNNVLAHERAHIERFDYLWKPLGFMVLAFYWFNPAIWLGYIMFCRDIEAACDEKVILDLNKEGRIEYSEALLSCALNRKMITICPLAFGENDVKGRIKRVLSYKKPAFWVSIMAVILCGIIAVFFLTNPSHDTVDSKTEKWFDYLDIENEVWNEEKQITLPEYPDVTFRLSHSSAGDRMEVLTDKDTILLYTGMPIWNAYFCDVTGDGFPEICSTINVGFGIIDSRIIIYDYVHGASYELSDRENYDFYFRYDESTGYLYVDKKIYNSDELVSSGRLIFKNGCIMLEDTERKFSQIVEIDYGTSSVYKIEDMSADIELIMC